MDKNDVKLIFNKLNFSPKKHLGQNFLIRKRTIEKIINLSEIAKDEVVLEVGAGLGALTQHLIKKAKKVYAYEIDSCLLNYLKEKFSEVSNLMLRNEDILKSDLPKYDKVISNPPYSITGPLFEKLFFNPNPPVGILLIEYQLAKRVFTRKEYKDFSRLSVSVNSFVNPVKQVKIPRQSFYPKPQINLSLIKVEPKDELHPFLKEEQTSRFFLDFIEGIFPYKNKNLSNAIKLFFKRKNITNIEKDAIKAHLKQNQIPNNKVFNYKINKYPNIAKCVLELIKSQ